MAGSVHLLQAAAGHQAALAEHRTGLQFEGPAIADPPGGLKFFQHIRLETPGFFCLY